MNIKNLFNRENILLAVAGGLGIALKSYVDDRRKRNTIAEEVDKWMKKNNN